MILSWFALQGERQNDVFRGPTDSGTSSITAFGISHFREIDELHPMVLGNGLHHLLSRRAFAT